MSGEKTQFLLQLSKLATLTWEICRAVQPSVVDPGEGTDYAAGSRGKHTIEPHHSSPTVEYINNAYIGTDYAVRSREIHTKEPHHSSPTVEYINSA